MLTNTRDAPRYSRLCRALGAAWIAACWGLPFPALAQFSSGSDGSDGALALTTPGTVDFDPVALGLDADGDGVFHFTTITVGPGVNVNLLPQRLSGPVFWLAQGAVQIDGVIDLSGRDGIDSAAILNDANRGPARPGPGGFSGGLPATPTSGATPGAGPGGGLITTNRGGGGGGHAAPGGGAVCVNFGCTGSNGGSAYGSVLAVPLIGGSGGGGAGWGAADRSGGGGAGGGALLIVSDVSIAVAGEIHADGGDGGASAGVGGGGGSGGAIRLVAPTVSGVGTLRAQGGAAGADLQAGCPGGIAIACRGGSGSGGRIRVEAGTQGFAGSATPPAALGTPFAVFLPVEPTPRLQIVSIGGVPVQNPSASFTPPDVTVDTGDPIAIGIESRSIPAGTVVQVHIISENASDQVVSSTPLAGSADPLSATATVTLPSGFSIGFARATWTEP